ncbi:MAG: hypothetical protein ACFCU3_05515 [Verrucomicrobiales bacterium]
MKRPEAFANIQHACLCAILGLGLVLTGCEFEAQDLSSLTPQPTPMDTIRRAILEDRLERASLLFEEAQEDPEAALALIGERIKTAGAGNLLGEALEVAVNAARAGQGARTRQAARLLRFGTALATTALERHAHPSGAFYLHDELSGEDAQDLWLTLPSGTARYGNRMVDAWDLTVEDLSPRQISLFKSKMERTGAWIYQNPILGTEPLPTSLGLLRLLWRLGGILEKPEWQSWSIATADQLFEVTDGMTGWFHRDGKPLPLPEQVELCRALSLYAWTTKNSEAAQKLKEVVRTLLAFSAPDLSLAVQNPAANAHEQNGRPTFLQVPGEAILASAALGDPDAAALVHADPIVEWSEDLSLWQAVFEGDASPAAEVSTERVTYFQPLETWRVRVGPWIIWFSGSARSGLPPGVAAVWHDEEGAYICLPGLVAEEQASAMTRELRLPDVFDRILGIQSLRGGREANVVQNFSLSEEDDVVALTWQQTLLSEFGTAAASVLIALRVDEEKLTVDLRSSPLAMDVVVGVPLRKDIYQYFALWDTEALQAMREGFLPKDRASEGPGPWELPNEDELGLQIDRAIYFFQLHEAPPRSLILANLGSSTRMVNSQPWYGVVLRANEEPSLLQFSIRRVTTIPSRLPKPQSE